MKETQRNIPIESIHFRKGCTYEMLNLHTQLLHADNNEYERIHTAKCRNAEAVLLCMKDSYRSMSAIPSGTKRKTLHENLC